ncbi:MAG: phospho-N-acetylmuramoyl-pentapeptide-transferase [Spirochaetes bacterium]|nr:phospho-N-acetylmuramoyl-pentapeptide-transferase [Spirochaetota bacterium]
MLKEIFLPLVSYFSFFNIFQYITFRAAYAAVTALLFSLLLGPIVIEWLRKQKLGQEIRDEISTMHKAKSGTPTMGGILIILAIVVSVLLWQDLRSIYTWICIVALLGFGAIGFVDDYLKIYKRNAAGLRAKFKFIAQILLSLAIVLFIFHNRNPETTLLYIPFFKYAILDLSYLYIPFGVLVLVGASNAVNLTDGLDGLATGLVVLVGMALGVLTYVSGRVDFAHYLLIPFIPGSGELTILACALVGAVVGFLWFNCHPAEVMMGDTGSLALGGIIGVMALLIKKEILLIIIGGVFVLEALSVIIQVVSYKLRKKRVFKMAPLHHHYELSGWSENKVVTRFWILGGLFVILSLSTLKIQ